MCLKKKKVLVFSCRKELKACLGKIPVFETVLPFRTKKNDCLLVICGMGAKSAFSRLQAVLDTYPVDGVLNFGLAGAYENASEQQEWNLGDTAIIGREIWSGNETLCSEFMRGVNDFGSELDIDPLQNLEVLGLMSPLGKIAVSATVCRPSIGAECTRLSKLAGVENMEGFALALACRIAAVPFVEIRTISNFCGETKRNKDGFSRACPALQRAFTALGL